MQNLASIHPRTSLSKFDGDSIHFFIRLLGQDEDDASPASVGPHEVPLMLSDEALKEASAAVLEQEQALDEFQPSKRRVEEG